MTQYKGNWIDRGDALEEKVARVIAFSLNLEPTHSAVVDAALTIRGLVEANASEVHVASYVRTVCESLDIPLPEGDRTRILGIALWHIAKAGLVRDRAARHAAELRRQLPPERPLGEQLRDAILRAPEE